MKKLGDYPRRKGKWPHPKDRKDGVLDALERSDWDEAISYSPVMGPRARWMAALDRFEEAKELGLCQHTRNPWYTLLCDSRMRVMCTLCGRMFGLHQQAADHWLSDHHNLDLIARKVS